MILLYLVTLLPTAYCNAGTHYDLSAVYYYFTICYWKTLLQQQCVLVLCGGRRGTKYSKKTGVTAEQYIYGLLNRVAATGCLF